ncbi:hypothetical protein BC835DRAFT_1416971 [Cytidiella melzeri]|nr:hypothetical protein BC835DRAFT_1416971 [Cytidiella melzeri]
MAGHVVFSLQMVSSMHFCISHLLQHLHLEDCIQSLESALKSATFSDEAVGREFTFISPLQIPQHLLFPPCPSHATIPISKKRTCESMPSQQSMPVPPGKRSGSVEPVAMEQKKEMGVPVLKRARSSMLLQGNLPAVPSAPELDPETTTISSAVPAVIKPPAAVAARKIPLPLTAFFPQIS